MAVLDGDLVYPVALRMQALSVPFVFATGYARDAIPQRCQDRPCVQKPIEAEALNRALRAALGVSKRLRTEGGRRLGRQCCSIVPALATITPV